MKYLVAGDANFTHRVALMEQIDEYVANVVVDTTCTAVTSEGVMVKDKEGNESLIPADTVIIAAGMRPRVEYAESFEPVSNDFIPIGDCVAAKDVGHATTTGYDAARMI